MKHSETLNTGHSTAPILPPHIHTFSFTHHYQVTRTKEVCILKRCAVTLIRYKIQHLERRLHEVAMPSLKRRIQNICRSCSYTQLFISGRGSFSQEVTALITLSSPFKNIPNCSLDSSISKVNILYKV